MKTLAVLLVAASPAMAQAVLDTALESRFMPAPERMYLTKALKRLGMHVKSGFVLFGIEVQPGPGSEPAVVADFRSSRTAAEALDALLRQAPGYEYEAISDHFVSIFRLCARI